MKESLRHYFKNYPFSILLILAVSYLSFFKPPSTLLDKVTYFDKVVHVGMYITISGLLWFEFFRSHKDAKPLWHGWVGAVLLPVLYGGAVELLQEYMTSYRGGDLWDFLANTVGVALGTLLAFTLLKRWIRH